MAIRDEETSSVELRRDSRFHHAALTADPKAKDLAPAVKQLEQQLKLKADAREEAESLRIESFAVLLRHDYELDHEINQVQLGVLGAVNKNREDNRYIAVFPHGLTAITGLRGEAEALAVENLVKALGTHFPALAESHATSLLKLAADSITAEKQWKKVEVDAAQALAEEIIARRELVRQLQKNEGALLGIYPGQRPRVRTYFRRSVQRSGKSSEG